MPEMVLEDGEQVDVGVGVKAISNKDRSDEPPPDPVRAPKGWRRDRRTGEWVPRQRAAAAGGDDEPSGERSESAWADGPDGKELRGSDAAVEPVKLTGEELADLEAMLELLALPVLARVDARDPHCGPVLVDNWDNIRAKSVPVILKSPRLVAWLTMTGGARDYLALAAALAPVGRAVWDHHVVRNVADEAGPDVSLDGYAA